MDVLESIRCHYLICMFLILILTPDALTFDYAFVSFGSTVILLNMNDPRNYEDYSFALDHS
jgi:hypothetical protein